MDTTHHALNHKTGPAPAPRNDTIIAIMHPWMALGAIITILIMLAYAAIEWSTLGIPDWAALITLSIITAILPAWPQQASWWALAAGTIIAASSLPSAANASALAGDVHPTPALLAPLILAALAAAHCHPLPWPIAAGALFAVGSAPILHGITLTEGITQAWWPAISLAIAAGTVLATIGTITGSKRRATPQYDERARLDAQLRLLRHGNQLAIEMHDTLSNDLTLISTIARQHQNDPNDPHHGDWALVLARSQQAFDEVHGIIRFLSETTDTGATDDTGGPSAATAAAPTDNVFDRITGSVNVTREFLERLGYHGQTAVSGIVMVVAPAVEQETLSLITEIGTNISRHAAPGDDAYLLHVSLNADAIEIRQTNDIPDHSTAPQLSDAERSGHGLAMHRRRIAELGGTCRIRAEEGTWMIYARIPCHGK